MSVSTSPIKNAIPRFTIKLAKYIPKGGGDFRFKNGINCAKCVGNDIIPIKNQIIRANCNLYGKILWGIYFPISKKNSICIQISPFKNFSFKFQVLSKRKIFFVWITILKIIFFLFISIKK